MTQLLQAVVLGIVQGLTEFIPVSSSGHLVLVPRLFGWGDPGLAFDVALHVGTLLAVLVYFRAEWVEVIKGFFTSFSARPSRWDAGQRLAWFLILATIPAAAAGALFSSVVEERLRGVGPVAVFLLVGAAAMALAEVSKRGARGFGQVKTRDAGAMGLLQAAALAPGLSRSGITISAGMLSGLEREAAARFSFMMLAPITAGAGLYEAVDVAKHGLGGSTWGMVAAGFATSAVVGFLTVKYLLGYLKRRTLMPFIIYSLAVGSAILLVLAVT